MRLPVERPARHVRTILALTLGLPLAACGTLGGGGADSPPVAAAQTNGPAADYPMVIGDPYRIGNTNYVPEDVLNYDEVGYLAADSGAGKGITAAHHTLPLPSYVEVTSLDSGRTILARVERRGPMDGNQLIALSPGAMAQLAATPGTAVRVRRVNPPEEQRALLRSGQTAPLRMDTPMSLVEVLKRRLPASGSAPLHPEEIPTSEPVLATPEPGKPASTQANTTPVAAAKPTPAPAPVAPKEPAMAQQAKSDSFDDAFKPNAPAKAQKPAAAGDFMVQAATFSTAERAEKAAGSLGGKVKPAGKYFTVRTGPFATRGEAEASLAKVKAAGYTDARIFTNG